MPAVLSTGVVEQPEKSTTAIAIAAVERTDNLARNMEKNFLDADH